MHAQLIAGSTGEAREAFSRIHAHAVAARIPFDLHHCFALHPQHRIVTCPRNPGASRSALGQAPVRGIAPGAAAAHPIQGAALAQRRGGVKQEQRGDEEVAVVGAHRGSGSSRKLGS
jgi:hypothetical protein